MSDLVHEIKVGDSFLDSVDLTRQDNGKYRIGTNDWTGYVGDIEPNQLLELANAIYKELQPE